MTMEAQPRFKVEVLTLEKPMKLRKETLEALKGTIKGKFLKRMKGEAVDCPVLKRRLPFLECFTCKNFLRRMKGQVDCEGSPLG